jgi:hypothetical protein
MAPNRFSGTNTAEMDLEGEDIGRTLRNLNQIRRIIALLPFKAA